MRVAIINAFNEGKTLSRTIDSIIDCVDKVVVMDGSYEPFESEYFYSTDETESVCQRDKVIFVKPEKKYSSQLEKRTLMFSVVPDASTFFIIDGDEWVVNPDELSIAFDHMEQSGADVGLVWQHSDLYDTPYTIARLLKNVPGMHHAGRHHWIFDKEKRLITSDQHLGSSKVVLKTSVRMYNERFNRDDLRKKKKNDFVSKRNASELSYEHELCVYGIGSMNKYDNAAGDTIRAPEYIKKSNDGVEHSMTLMISRPWMVDKYFSHLRTMDIPDSTELIVLIDGNNLYMKSRVIQRLKSIASRFSSVLFRYTGNTPLPEFSNASKRRQRIIENWHKILPLCRGTYIIGTEDDSLPEHVDTYKRLMSRIKDESCDYVQADIVNRWSPPFHPAWKVEERDSLPLKVYQLNSGDVEQIDAVGWYCFATRRDVFLSVELKNDGYLPLGPDLRFGYDLMKRGYRLLHDFNLPVSHVTQKEVLQTTVDSSSVSWKKVGEQWILQ